MRKSRNKAVFLLIIIVLGFMSMRSYLINRLNSHGSFSDVVDGQLITVSIGDPDSLSPLSDKKLNVELVNSAEAITQGLSDRETIGSDGMLFDMSRSGIATFWMKDMLMDLDFVWISGNTIIGFEKNVPKPELNTKTDDLVIYSPESPVDMILELNAGDIEKYNLEIGDVIILEK